MQNGRSQKTISRAFAITLLGFAANVYAGPKVHVSRAVAPNQRVSIDQIEHATWDALLTKYVNQRGEVDYRGWQANQNDVAALDQYLQALAAANPDADASRNARLAFWINAYNATTVKGILREYPTTSIRNHTPRLYGYHIWKDLLLMVGGKTYSLDDIEHQVLRKMGEPRIHFAIVCASTSCPRLLNQAYTANRLDEQLTINAKDFFANPRNFRYDPSKGQFQLSSILDWFGKDFGDTQPMMLQGVAGYLPDAASKKAASIGSGKVGFLKYDWSLNEQKTLAANSR